MTRYVLEMIETRSVDITYVVEADSVHEAQSKALVGDTVEEYAAKESGVLDREIFEGPRKESST